MPQIVLIVPSLTKSATFPSTIKPLIVSKALIEACITKKLTSAEKAAVAFSCFAIPIAIPTANKAGRLSKTILPALHIIVNNA